MRLYMCTIADICFMNICHSINEHVFPHFRKLYQKGAVEESRMGFPTMAMTLLFKFQYVQIVRREEIGQRQHDNDNTTTTTSLADSKRKPKHDLLTPKERR